MAGEISRRQTGRLGRVDTAELSPYMARRVQMAAEDDASAAIIAESYIENGRLLVERAIQLTADLSAEAQALPVHSPYDQARYETFVNAFVELAHRTIRAYGHRL